MTAKQRRRKAQARRVSARSQHLARPVRDEQPQARRRRVLSIFRTK